MSRIEEALKRAAAINRNSAVSLEERRGHAADASMLERYERETSGHQPPAPRVVPVSRPASVEAPTALNIPDRSKLVVGENVAPAIVEQYRRLAAVLHELQIAQGFKTLMVSSALPREGKTLTVANLAVTLSESYRRRVLLIDADMRRPTVHDVFGIPNGKGLGEVLTGSDHSLPVVERSQYLSVLTAGRAESNTTAQLTSPRLQAVVKEASSRFDWVLLDTPPIALLTDAQLVARLCDGVLFVIGAGSTPLHVVQRSIAEIGVERIVGTVLNRVQPQGLTSDYYSHAHYYSPDAQASR